MTTGPVADMKLSVRLASDGTREAVRVEAPEADGGPRTLSDDELEAIVGGNLTYEVTYPDGCTFRYNNFPGNIEQAQDLANEEHQALCPNN